MHRVLIDDAAVVKITDRSVGDLYLDVGVAHDIAHDLLQRLVAVNQNAITPPGALARVGD